MSTLNEHGNLEMTSIPRMRREIVSTAPSSGRLDNLAISGYGRVRLTGASAAYELTGIVPPTSDSQGALLIVENGTAYVMTIKAENVNSTAANRIKPIDVAIASKGAALLSYSEDEARWIYLGPALVISNTADGVEFATTFTGINASAAGRKTGWTVPNDKKWIFTGLEIEYTALSGTLHSFDWQLGGDINNYELVGSSGSGVTAGSVNEAVGRFERYNLAPSSTTYKVMAAGTEVAFTVLNAATDAVTISVHLRGFIVAA